MRTPSHHRGRWGQAGGGGGLGGDLRLFMSQQKLGVRRRLNLALCSCRRLFLVEEANSRCVAARRLHRAARQAAAAWYDAASPVQRQPTAAGSEGLVVRTKQAVELRQSDEESIASQNVAKCQCCTGLLEILKGHCPLEKPPHPKCI